MKERKEGRMLTREIKFRGKRVDNGEWVYGYYYMRETSQNAYIVLPISGIVWNVIPESVGQYTGLKDSNGTEIYEGDVVLRSGVDLCTIVWRADRCKYDFRYQVELMSPQWMNGIDDYYAKTELEVKGNIYENK
jgi:uncharacterized phage protein (TIGR01671 family)